MKASLVRFVTLVGMFGLLLGLPVSPAAAQEYQLFDRFLVGLSGSIMSFDTTIRLDSERLGLGTEIDFESDFGLDSSKIIPAFGFQWFTTEGKHRIGLRYFNANRSATTQVAKEIRFGDTVFPLESRVGLSYDWEQFSVDYTWFFKRKDRWMLGLLVGFRWIDVTATLAVENLQLAEEGAAAAPLPYIGLEYRLGISPRVRMILLGGLLQAKFGDISGATGIANIRFEFLTWDHFGFSAGAGSSYANVEDTSDSLVTFDIDTSISQVSAGVIARW